MGKTLVVLEVARKQSYIFRSKQLRDNVQRSLNIRTVTDPSFFAYTAIDLFQPDNLVYAGGGHAILRFDTEEQCDKFCRCITRFALTEFDGMEIYAKRVAYDEMISPQENVQSLLRELERKKAFRKASIRSTSFGVETLSDKDFRPIKHETSNKLVKEEPVAVPPEFWFPRAMDELGGADNFVAVVHIDGNMMGARVAAVQQKYNDDWKTFCLGMQRFSESVMHDYEKAFQETVKEMIDNLSITSGALPIRPVVLAGDDVCFITSGRYGLEAAAIFLDNLSHLSNIEDGKAYSACAGIAIVHSKYPFHRAYKIAEELCSNAKRYGASLQPDGSLCAMDWHIEYGQMRGELQEIRQSYLTEDGNRMDLRPVVVIPTTGVGNPFRNYSFVRNFCNSINQRSIGIARGKLKELRNAIRQGEIETEFFMRQNEIEKAIHNALLTCRMDAEELRSYREKQLIQGKTLREELFFDDDGVKRSVLFDPIEIVDHFSVIREVWR